MAFIAELSATDDLSATAQQVEGGFQLNSAIMPNVPFGLKDSGNGFMNVSRYGNSARMGLQHVVQFNNPKRQWWRKFDTGFTPSTFTDWKMVGYDSRVADTYLPLLGDSNVAFDHMTIPIQDATGAVVLNCGVPGAMLTSPASPATIDALSPCRIADAIVANANGDAHAWDNLDAAATAYVSTYDVRPAIANLKLVDFTKVVALPVFITDNDFGNARPLGNPEVIPSTPTDDTVAGATYYFIKKVCSRFPDLRPVFFTPGYRSRIAGAPDSADCDYVTNAIGLLLNDDYGRVVARACELSHVAHFDLRKISGINKYNVDSQKSDGLHLTDAVHGGPQVGAAAGRAICSIC